MRRLAWLLLVVVLLAACSSPTAKKEQPVWANKAPASPDTTDLNRGDADKRPVIHKVGISAYEQKNGWWIAPMSLYRIVANVENADKVTIHGFDPGELINPDKDGFLDEPVLQKSDGTVQRWVVTVGNCCGGQSAGFYAVAENQFGRTVSPAFFVAWVTDSSYTAKELKEP